MWERRSELEHLTQTTELSLALQTTQLLEKIKTSSYQSFVAKQIMVRRQYLKRLVEQQHRQRQQQVVEVREAANQERLEEKVAFAFAEVLKTSSSCDIESATLGVLGKYRLVVGRVAVRQQCVDELACREHPCGKWGTSAGAGTTTCTEHYR